MPDKKDPRHPEEHSWDYAHCGGCLIPWEKKSLDSKGLCPGCQPKPPSRAAFIHSRSLCQLGSCPDCAEIVSDR